MATILRNVVNLRPTGAKPRLRLRRAPSEGELLAIPLAASGEYEISDEETKTLRRQIYSINKHNVAGIRFRTMREAPFTFVWRIH